MRTNDPPSTSELANPYQPPIAESPRTMPQARHSRIGLASLGFAIVDVVATAVYISTVMAGPPVVQSVSNASSIAMVVASPLGVVTGLASLFVRTRSRALGIVGLAISGTIGLSLVVLIFMIARALGD